MWKYYNTLRVRNCQQARDREVSAVEITLVRASLPGAHAVVARLRRPTSSLAAGSRLGRRREWLLDITRKEVQFSMSVSLKNWIDTAISRRS